MEFKEITSPEWTAAGILHVLLGNFFFTVKPYRKTWMNHADGLIFTAVGVLMLIEVFNSRPVYILRIAVSASIAWKCTKERRNLCAM